MNTHQLVIAADGLCYAYGAAQVIDRVHLGWGPGIHGLLGVNGAGKTTLLRMAATLQAPSAGSLTVCGHDVSSARGRSRARAAMGFLPQDPSWPGHFTVREFADYFCWLRRVPRGQRATAAARAIAAVGLEDKASWKLGALSGGQLRRALLVQAIVHRPAALLLDEPTAGLDPVQRVRVRDQLLTLSNDSSVVIATHLVEDIAAVARTITVLDEGRVAFSGSPAELTERARPDLPGATQIERGFHAVIRSSDD